jgi:hypothetical protein
VGAEAYIALMTEDYRRQKQDIIDCRTSLMSHRHASTVSMVGALHQTIDKLAREYKKLFDTI